MTQLELAETIARALDKSGLDEIKLAYNTNGVVTVIVGDPYGTDDDVSVKFVPAEVA